MATKETSELGPPHEPRGESVKAFQDVEHELRKQLVHLRHDHDKHEPMSFAAARHLSDSELAHFTTSDFVLVRVASTAYGIILFGKLRIPALPTRDDAGQPLPAFVHFRIFSEGPEQDARFHSFHTQETDLDADGGDRAYRSLFTEDDALDWFDA